jgi:aarF domain-containing kinase
MASSGVASAAAMATAAVNAAVSMRTLEAPDRTTKSYIALNSTSSTADLDSAGLPLVYDKVLIEAYWNKERGALNKRWGQFVQKAVPFFTKLTTLYIRDGRIADSEIPGLSRQARLDLQDLGPTFIKAGQMMSVRPDVLPQSTLDELTKLQDSVVPFDTRTAVQQVESELGGPLGQFFSSISDEPVAAASLAQVYRATLLDGTRVAVKVQRPDVLATVSKDLYVLRRAAEVFNGLVQRFAPQQRTDYVALLNEWAIGFYTELDFLNEAANQRRLRQMFLDKNITNVVVPKVFDEFCTRRVLVSEWVDGIKLSQASKEEIAAVTPAAQEAFLTQLFDVGFFHADPHPGNLLLLHEPIGNARLALIDCGLMASIDEKDRDNMISAVIHLANKDYAALVDDFINLEILPPDTNRLTVVPLMDKALSPYVMGGGAKKYEEELKKLYGMEDGSMKSQVGGFQAMTQDALTVLEKVPFSIPPYFAILGRAIVTLEGVALTGNENYGIILESYPFIARKLLREGRPEIQKALQQVLYSGGSGESSGLKLTRLLALLNNAAGAVVTQDGAAFVDLDAIPEDGISLKEGLKFVLSDNAASLQSLLESEMDNVVDVLSRQLIRRAVSEALVTLTPPRPPVLPFLGDLFPTTPALDEIPMPILLPGLQQKIGLGSRPSFGLLTIKEFTNVAAPPLNRDEEIFAIGLAEGAGEFFGDEIGDLLKGRRVLSVESVDLVLRALRSGVLARPNLINPASADVVIQNVQNAFESIFSRRRSRRRSVTLEKGFAAALESLSAKERERFDNIANELTQRAMQRIIQRLSKIERVL